MRRKPKPQPVPAAEVVRRRPPCAFKWSHGDGDCECEDRPYLHSCGCACGRPQFEHDRYTIAMRAGIIAERIEREESVMRRVVDRALAAAVPVRQRAPMRTGVLQENGKPRRYLLDGEAIGGDDPEVP